MQQYLDWIVGRALPTWATDGFDRASGRFRERLDASGAPLPVAHRSMVQARQIYVFSHAARLGWFAAGGALAEVAMASLLRDFARQEGGATSFAFSIDPATGAVVSDVRDAYAHAFVLFAFASLHRLNGDPALLDHADRTIAYVDGALADPAHGGLFDAVPVTDTTKRQNPLMHLLEAYLALERAAPGRGYLARAEALVALFARRLFDAERGVLLEYFSRDWAAHPDPARARAFEPGHHFEWVWLLDEYRKLSGRPVVQWADPLYAVARDHGIAPGSLVFDELAADTMAVTKRAHRVWPHTEAIKAAAARHAAGDPAARGLADGMAGALMQTFLDRPFAGGWTDHVSEAGAPLVEYVPASSLYHLFFAAGEAAAGFGLRPTGLR